MSHTMAPGLRRKRIRTSNNSLWSLGPAWMISFKEIPLHLAEQSKTILTLVVDLLILTIGKCGRYQISGGGASVSGTLRRYPFSTYVSTVFWYSFSTNSLFSRFLLVLRRRDSAICRLLAEASVFSMARQHCISHCCSKQNCWLFLRPLPLLQCTQFDHIVQSRNSQSPRSTHLETISARSFQNAF